MSEQQWYWDLQRGAAVQASDRGKADHLLGPYPTQADAEHWKDRVEARNESWKEADKEWAGDDDDDEPATDD